MVALCNNKSAFEFLHAKCILAAIGMFAEKARHASRLRCREGSEGKNIETHAAFDSKRGERRAHRPARRAHPRTPGQAAPSCEDRESQVSTLYTLLLNAEEHRGVRERVDDRRGCSNIRCVCRWYTEERAAAASAGSSSRPRRPPPPGRLPTRLSRSRSPDGPTAAGSERPSRRHSLRVPRGAGECLPAGVSAVQYEVGAGRVLRSFQEVHTDRTGSHRPNSSGTGGEVHSWVHIPRLIPLAHTTLH